MQKRSVRLTAIALLLTTPLAAAYLWNLERQTRQLSAAHAVTTARIDRMVDAVGAIGTAQQSYVAPGQLDEPSFERVTELVGQLKDDLATLGPLLQSPDGPKRRTAFDESLDALVTADGRTRQNLKLGQDLMAADVIFSDGRNVLDAMIGRLRELQGAERAAHRADLTSLSRQGWLAFGLVTLVWVVLGGFLLHVERVLSDAPVSLVQEDPAYAHKGKIESPPAANSVNLTAVATLCTDLSRASDTAALSQLLGRAASVLDASGVILWMSAGEQLFAVLGWGYPPTTLARFGPIARVADNAASTAWRTGRLSVVAAEGVAPGGLVAPLFGPGGCMGVLALEIRHGHEQDPAVQAVTAMVAAQLATVVAAWPAASLTQAPEARTA